MPPEILEARALASVARPGSGVFRLGELKADRSAASRSPRAARYAGRLQAVVIKPIGAYLATLVAPNPQPQNAERAGEAITDRPARAAPAIGSIEAAVHRHRRSG